MAEKRHLYLMDTRLQPWEHSNLRGGRASGFYSNSAQPGGSTTVLMPSNELFTSLIVKCPGSVADDLSGFGRVYKPGDRDAARGTDGTVRGGIGAVSGWAIELY